MKKERTRIARDKLPERFYRFARPILGSLYRLYYHPRIIGKENIPKSGPIIIAGNHIHAMDQCNIIVSTRRVVHYMAKKEYFDGHFAWFFKATGCISVDRQNKDEVAKEEALNILEDGGAIGIFPEGTRNRTEDLLLPFKYGAVSMAKKTGAYIVPFSVSGDYKFRSKNLVIRIGKPFRIKIIPLEEANKLLYRKIKKLLLKQNKKR